MVWGQIELVEEPTPSSLEIQTGRSGATCHAEFLLDGQVRSLEFLQRNIGDDAVVDRPEADLIAILYRKGAAVGVKVQ